MKKFAITFLAVLMLAAFAIPASAGITNGNGTDFGETASKYVFEASGTITGFTINFTIDDMEDGFGGGIVWADNMFEDDWWTGWTEWGNEDAGKPIVSDGSTIRVTLDAPLTVDGPAVMIEQWWGDDITITGATFTYEATGNNDTATGTPRADGDVKAGVGDVAVASAIALVAAGAVIFSRKKK